MRHTVGAAAAAVVGYGLGTLPSAAIAARWAGSGGPAIHKRGTGNPGGMNAGHVLGRRWGVAVTIADILKGTAAAAAGRRLAGERGANLAAGAAVIGHCHPVGRRGGKGVATSIGQVIGTFPAYLPIDAGVALSTAALPWFKRRTEMATIVASSTWIGCGLLWWRKGWSAGRRMPTTAAVPVAAAASSAVIMARFRVESARVDSFNADALEAER